MSRRVDSSAELGCLTRIQQRHLACAMLLMQKQASASHGWLRPRPACMRCRNARANAAGPWGQIWPDHDICRRMAMATGAPAARLAGAVVPWDDGTDFAYQRRREAPLRGSGRRGRQSNRPHEFEVTPSSWPAGQDTVYLGRRTGIGFLSLWLCLVFLPWWMWLTWASEVRADCGRRSARASGCRRPYTGRRPSTPAAAG
jgi:hypothetical protein